MIVIHNHKLSIACETIKLTKYSPLMFMFEYLPKRYDMRLRLRPYPEIMFDARFADDIDHDFRFDGAVTTAKVLQWDCKGFD